MPRTKTETAIELVRVRVKAQTRKDAAHGIAVSDLSKEDEKLEAQQQYAEFAREEADLLEKEESDTKEMERLKRQESYLQIDLL
ncbi:hypothetical protein F52700_2833 [Fusarium sp. NRRL 52700]|nr:hypothetical protein F52700_2833 [Fusarium sp. NRRL 52700]